MWEFDQLQWLFRFDGKQTVFVCKTFGAIQFEAFIGIVAAVNDVKPLSTVPV